MATKQTKAAKVLPTKVVLARPHGFIAEDGTTHYWPEGFVEDCPVKIKILINRNATLKETNDAS